MSENSTDIKAGSRRWKILTPINMHGKYVVSQSTILKSKLIFSFSRRLANNPWSMSKNHQIFKKP